MRYGDHNDEGARDRAEQRAMRGGAFVSGRNVTVYRPGVGIGTWGALDFLRKAGYTVIVAVS